MNSRMQCICLLHLLPSYLGNVVGAHWVAMDGGKVQRHIAMTVLQPALYACRTQQTGGRMNGWVGGWAGYKMQTACHSHLELVLHAPCIRLPANQQIYAVFMAVAGRVVQAGAQLAIPARTHNTFMSAPMLFLCKRRATDSQITHGCSQNRICQPVDCCSFSCSSASWAQCMATQHAPRAPDVGQSIYRIKGRPQLVHKA
jgi:hypothetical protein